MCRVTVSTKFAVVIVICLLGAAVSKQCRKLDAALSKLCGYEYTVEFQHESHFNSSLKALDSFNKQLGNCSKYSNLILCSLNLPRCEEDIPGPYLPCKRVCDEYVKGCGKSIVDAALEWSVGTCQLLPEYDDPKTTKGYLGRCFEPPNFTPTAECWKLVEPLCQGLGYNETFVSENTQRLYSETLKYFIGDYKNDKKCGELRRQFICGEILFPCKDGKLQYLCQSKCNMFFETCESPELPYGKEMCMDFPDGNSPTGFCHQTHWPRYGNWPTPPTTIPITTTTPTGHRVTMTTRKEDNGNEPTSELGTDKPNISSVLASRSCSERWLVIICMLVVLVFILLATVAFLSVKLYRRRRSGLYVYENRLYIPGKDDTFEKR